MIQEFESIIFTLFRPREEEDTFSVFDPTKHLEGERTDDTGIGQAVNASFLITLAGSTHPAYERAKNLLLRMADSPEWTEIAEFYLNGIELIHTEIETTCKRNPDFAEQLRSLSEWVSNQENLKNTEEAREHIWSVFCPEATGIRGHEQERIETLRASRTVILTQLATTPITDPGRELLLTSNVLFSPPPAAKSLDEFPLSGKLRETLHTVCREPQLYWYDHPIQMDGQPERNEVLYGLRELEAALEFETVRGNIPREAKVPCVLSVSVTHRGLQRIAKGYLEEQFARCGGLKNIQAYVLTEADTQRIIDEILAPAAERYLQQSHSREILGVFGVDGEYGRHYSFLKAIAAFWRVFIQPEIKATFKVDLDQVFPQEALVAQTGASAFEHFTTPLWGAQGLDSHGHPVELGMIAGALVNQQDIGKSLFTPDVPFPGRELSQDEYIFFSALPQALSTQAEMMTRYSMDKLDGKSACIQRIHVTGGTTGILIDSLRRHRPFTPSFIGRAEDQAYILSVFPHPGPKLAYVHKDGLIMRHDKETFAQESIQSAYVGKLIGDYVRILSFSAYANLLTDDIAELKESLDPFTGCFLSRIPTTVVHLRFALKAASFFTAGKRGKGLELITTGVRRIRKTLDFLRGENSLLKQQFEKERLGWAVYYNALSSVEEALNKKESFALELRKKAGGVIDQCRLRFDSGGSPARVTGRKRRSDSE
ncbi:MAG: hypothetical protein ACE5IP_01840 [Terriglobia bacterium]